MAAWCVVVPLRFRSRFDRSSATVGWTVYIESHIAVTALFEHGLTQSLTITRFVWPNPCSTEIGEARVCCKQRQASSRNAVSRIQCAPS